MPKPKPRPLVPITILATLFLLMPVLFWYQTWFGRRLTNQEIGTYLADYGHPRKIQHALAQISDRMAQGDRAIAVWYPRVAEAARRPDVDIRTTAAWTMGQDNSSELLHTALLGLLRDPELVVRRNAALALVRFADPAGHDELVAMLRPYELRATGSGALSFQVRQGQQVKRGSTIARVNAGLNSGADLLAPCTATVETLLGTPGSRVQAGDAVASLAPLEDEVWEALRGLYLVGRPEDLDAVLQCARHGGAQAPRIREQAQLTAQAIRKRSEPSPTR